MPASLGRKGVWDRLHGDLLRLLRQQDKLDPDVVIVAGVLLHAFGGEQTGPSPVDRCKKRSKHTLLADRHGVPLAIHTATAKARDHRQIIPLVLDFPTVGGKPGRPKETPRRWQSRHEGLAIAQQPDLQMQSSFP